MLSFIDDAAKNSAPKSKAPTAQRFHVRRRSGKVFGPFKEDVVVKMLGNGQLLGNEDVSHDNESWVPIGTLPAFAAAIQQMMERPAGTAAAPARPSGESPTQATPASSNLERIQQLYGGRMAAVAVVDGGGGFEALRKRLPLIIAAAAVLLVLGTGFSFHFTRYGAFGLKKFLPARVKQGSPTHATLETARKELLQDSFQSYTQARQLSAQVLASTEYPEVRALWCQAIFYLQRRYAAATGTELNRCRAERPNLELLGEKNVELIKFLAGEALVSRQPDAVIPRLQGALSREGNQGDSELAFLLAEAYALKRQNEQAVEMLNRVLERNPESSKAHHALGNLYQATGKADEAAQAYEAALQADPHRVISAVELAAVELLLRKNAQKGLDAAERALDEKLQVGMGPAEIARVRTLKGIALFQLFKPRQAEEELRAALEQEPDSIFTKGHLARVLRSQRQFSAALPFYKEAATAEPQNLEYTDGYINTLVATGNMEEALKVVEDASGRFPGDARIAFLFGRIDDARDNLSAAESHYKSALAANADLFEAHVYLGRLYLRQRRNADAKAQLEQAAAKAPRNAGVRAALGELALAEKDLRLAHEEFSRAVEYDPTLAEVHLGLSRLALLNGDLAQAEKAADTALELDPHLLKDGRLQRGIVLWRLGKLDEAIATLEKAKLEDPRSVNIPITLGAVLLEKGLHKEAEANLLLALTRAPSTPEAHFYMAHVKAARAEFTQALDSMKNAVDGAPKRADYRFAFGNLYRDAKRPADAIEQWKKAVELEPTLADAHQALGQLYLERTEFDKAIDSFQATLEADPTRTRVLTLIGDAHFTALRWREAIRSYELAYKKDPSLTSIFYKVGRCYAEQLLHSQAIFWYQKANKAEPDNPLPWYYLGFAYKEKGRRKEAVKAFKEYLARTPDAVDRMEIEDEISFLE
jgi:cellulose synthase operon protein C